MLQCHSFDLQNVFKLPQCVFTPKCILTSKMNFDFQNVFQLLDVFSLTSVLYPLWEPKVNHFHITMVIWQLNSIQITHFCLKVLYRYIYLIRQGASINSNYDKHFWHHSWLRSKETKECWIFLERDQPSNITVVLNFNNITKGPEFPAKRSFHQHVNVFSILERLVQPVKWILDEKCIFHVNSETHMINCHPTKWYAVYFITVLLYYFMIVVPYYCITVYLYSCVYVNLESQH